VKRRGQTIGPNSFQQQLQAVPFTPQSFASRIRDATGGCEIGKNVTEITPFLILTAR
jgi:hypothetical protein